MTHSFVFYYTLIVLYVSSFIIQDYLNCIFTLVIVMLVFSYGICNISGQLANAFSVGFITISLPIIFCVAPVPHPNKPMSEEKGIRLRKRSYILTVILSAAVIALLIFQYQKLSLYVSSGILLSAIAALLGHFLNRGDKNKR